MEHIHLYEEPEFDAETQERLDSQVDKLLKGYDWTLAPLANKYVTYKSWHVLTLQLKTFQSNRESLQSLEEISMFSFI